MSEREIDGHRPGDLRDAASAADTAVLQPAVPGRDSPPLHLLHIPKTGGTALKFALAGVDPAPLVLHRHATRMADIPRGEGVIVMVRHPVQRFVSGFNCRLRQGRPRYNAAWTDEEAEAFTHFDTPLALAEALSAPEGARRRRAREAMAAIAHIRLGMTHWISLDELASRKDDIVFVARQDTLDVDFERMRRLLRLPAGLRLPEDAVAAHRSPASLDAGLSPLAEANLRKWYRDDFVLFQRCAALRRDIITRHFPPRRQSGQSGHVT